eukprot:4610015-Pleurochrysis_carterae.AAC.6
MEGTHRTSVRVNSTIRFCESLTESGRSPTATHGRGFPSTPDTDSAQGRTFVPGVSVAEASRSRCDECAGTRGDAQFGAGDTRSRFGNRCRSRGGIMRASTIVLLHVFSFGQLRSGRARRGIVNGARSETTGQQTGIRSVDREQGRGVYNAGYAQSGGVEHPA